MSSTVDYKTELLQRLEATLPEVFSRDVAQQATGGLCHRRTLANLDSLGEGPQGKMKMRGGRVGYTKRAFLEWFAARIQVADAASGGAA